MRLRGLLILSAAVLGCERGDSLGGPESHPNVNIRGVLSVGAEDTLQLAPCGSEDRWRIERGGEGWSAVDAMLHVGRKRDVNDPSSSDLATQMVYLEAAGDASAMENAGRGRVIFVRTVLLASVDVPRNCAWVQ